MKSALIVAVIFVLNGHPLFQNKNLATQISMAMERAFRADLRVPTEEFAGSDRITPHSVFLNKILQKCRQERRPSQSQRQDWEKRARDGAPTRDFRGALLATAPPRIIAEFKRASPSKGEISPGAHPATIAHAYASGGACAMSVLTEEFYFRGNPEDLQAARRACSLPILRKDFLESPWEIYQARAWGADALLLISSILELSQLAELLHLTHELGMEALVEVHSQEDLDKALGAKPRIVGINNRDLVSFQVNLDTSHRLAQNIPKDIIKVSESGFYSRQQIGQFPEVDAFLIGESLMREADPRQALRQLRGKE